MTRVLHIFGRMNRGGAELRTLDVLRRLEVADPRMEFLALSGLEGDLDETIRAHGGEVHYCRLDIAFPWRFARLLRDRRIDVVHSHVHHFSGYILRCAARVGVPVRIAHFRNCHSGNPPTLRHALQERLMKYWINRWATLILGNSDSSLRFGWTPQWNADPRCAIIHNGLDTAPFRIKSDPVEVRQEFGLPTACPLVIHVGRMAPAKNHTRLMSIWNYLAESRPDMRFISVGRIQPKIHLDLLAQVQGTALQNRITWAGERVDVPRLLLASDLMYFPSKWEGLPGAVLEANAAGVPVIGSDIAPIREIAQHLSNVKCMSLTDATSSWAANAVGFAQSANTNRLAATRQFESSVYAIGRCVRAHNIAWAGGSNDEIRNSYTFAVHQDTSEAA